MALALIFAILGLAFGSSAGSDVQDLTTGFAGVIPSQEIMLVEFFAPWCGHCKKLAPEYEIAATKLKKDDPPIPLAKVDCTADSGKETCSKYGVSGYPTLKIFRNGEISSDYSGPRSADGIVSTMKKMAGPLAREIKTVDQLEKARMDITMPVIVGFFSKEGADRDAFIKAASTLHENFKFVYSVAEEVNKQYGQSDAVVILRSPLLKSKFEEEIQVMTTPITSSGIEKFVKSSWNGKCGVMTPDNNSLFKKPVIVVYYDVDYKKNPKGTNYWRNRVMKVGKSFTDKDVTFAIAASDDFRRELDSFGMKDTSDPQVAAWDANGNKYKMEDKFSVTTFAAFVEKFLAGELEAYLKSEPVPESNDGPVKVVVGKNFDEIVMDNSKDVLIEFYAPWCGHCKSLEPKYNELGEKLQDVEHVTIAKMDATANDAPGQFEVSGFPTIYWAPAGNKNKPQKYQGGREVDDFVKFIKSESTKPVNLDEKKKKKKLDEL